MVHFVSLWQLRQVSEVGGTALPLILPDKLESLPFRPSPSTRSLRRGVGEVRLGFEPSLRAHFSSHGARLQISFLEVNPAPPT
jgi:hypothetical protein